MKMMMIMMMMIEKINIDDIPLQLTIDGTGYHFLCVTVFVNENHFKAIFRLND
jgi:hypothetical protein